jgi:hypothetical protein
LWFGIFEVNRELGVDWEFELSKIKFEEVKRKILKKKKRLKY